ncbi:hypothetical protein NFI96_021849 [Prochilodus magdalenae]|nr:hypothetical protein NFI96_021849 [Prochilodus magdalenae]
MFQIGSWLGHIHLSSGPGGSSSSTNSTDPGGSGGSGGSFSSSGPPISGTRNRQENIPSLPEFIQRVRRVSGLRREDLFCNLRVPNQFQTSREEISLLVLTGSGVYCIDVKPWAGVVSAQAPNTWHLRMKEEEPNFTHTSIQQVSDPLQAITSCVVQRSADGAALTGGLMEDTTARWRSVMVDVGSVSPCLPHMCGRRLTMSKTRYTDLAPWEERPLSQTVSGAADCGRKASDLCSHMKRCGVSVQQSAFLPRVLFLSPRCVLDDELRKRKELVSCGDLETFLRSLREGYMSWITDALTPSWISGHLSFRQLGAVRAVLGQMGTWDLVQLSSGTELKGDYQGCQHLALNRQDTDVLEFSRGRTLSTDTLWALLGHTPQITPINVDMPTANYSLSSAIQGPFSARTGSLSALELGGCTSPISTVSSILLVQHHRQTAAPRRTTCTQTVTTTVLNTTSPSPKTAVVPYQTVME